MLRCWLALLAVLAGIGFSFAADQSSPLSKDERWQEARKSLAEGRAAEAKATFEELLQQYPEDADLQLFLGISLRSEEHTSELQSLRHLVCRLLLEKKKKH